MRHAGRLLVLIVLALAPSLARAAGDLDPDTEIAQRHFRAGADAYERSDYPTALKEFEEAQRVKPVPAFEFNIARTLDRMERFDEAITHYRKYLATDPREPGEVKDRLRVLEARKAELDAEKAAADRAAREKAAADEAARARRELARAELARENAFGHRYLVPLLVGAGALAAGAAGAGLVGSVAPDYAALDSGPTSCRPCSASRYSGLQARADAGYALLAVAGALAVTDVILWVWKARHHAPSPVATAGSGIRF